MKLRLLTAFVRPALLRASAGQGGDATYNTLTVTGQGLFADGSAAAPSIAFSGATTTGFFRSGGAVQFSNAGTTNIAFGAGITLRSSVALNWTSGVPTAAADLSVARDAANTLALRNGTTAQTFRVYNTFTDSSNYERLRIGTTATENFVLQENAGSGAARELTVGTSGANVLNLRTNATNRWRVDASGHLIGVADNTYDIGATGATRPRTGYFGTSLHTQALLPAARYITGSYSLQSDDFTILASTGTNAITVLLPTAPAAAQMVNVKKTSTDTRRLTIDGNGNLIDGLTTASTIAQTRPNFQLQFASAAAGGSMWHIL